MPSIDENELKALVEGKMCWLRSSVIDDMKEMRLEDLLARKNPYWYLTKNFSSLQDLVKHLLDAALYEGEETKFGTVLEEIARYVAEKNYGAIKSSAEGIDLEFVKQGKTYLIPIKSGPNWGNASQIEQMKRNFASAKRRLKSNNTSDQNIVCLNGCCYGRTGSSPDKGDYIKLCGQEFWELVSGDRDFYICPALLDALQSSSKNRSEDFKQAYEALVVELTAKLSKDYCKADGSIDYEAILRFNSGSKSYQKEDLNQTIAVEVGALFGTHSSEPFLQKDFVVSIVCGKLGAGPEEYASTSKAVLEHMKSSPRYEVKRDKVYPK